MATTRTCPLSTSPSSSSPSSASPAVRAATPLLHPAPTSTTLHSPSSTASRNACPSPDTILLVPIPTRVTSHPVLPATLLPPAPFLSWAGAASVPVEKPRWLFHLVTLHPTLPALSTPNGCIILTQQGQKQSLFSPPSHWPISGRCPLFFVRDTFLIFPRHSTQDNSLRRATMRPNLTGLTLAQFSLLVLLCGVYFDAVEPFDVSQILQITSGYSVDNNAACGLATGKITATWQILYSTDIVPFIICDVFYYGEEPTESDADIQTLSFSINDTGSAWQYDYVGDFFSLPPGDHSIQCFYDEPPDTLYSNLTIDFSLPASIPPGAVTLAYSTNQCNETGDFGSLEVTVNDSISLCNYTTNQECNYIYWMPGLIYNTTALTGLTGGTYQFNLFMGLGRCHRAWNYSLDGPSFFLTTTPACYDGGLGTVTARPELWEFTDAPSATFCHDGSCETTPLQTFIYDAAPPTTFFNVSVPGFPACTFSTTAGIAIKAPVLDPTGSYVTNSTCATPGTGGIDLSSALPGTVGTWSDSGATTLVRTNLSPGTYGATLSYSGCTENHTFTVYSPPALVVTTYNSTPASPCAKVGSASVAVSGGVPPYNYNWLGFSSGPNSPTITGVIAQVLTACFITDAVGCTRQSPPIWIGNSSAPYLVVDSLQPYLCSLSPSNPNSGGVLMGTISLGDDLNPFLITYVVDQIATNISVTGRTFSLTGLYGQVQIRVADSCSFSDQLVTIGFGPLAIPIAFTSINAASPACPGSVSFVIDAADLAVPCLILLFDSSGTQLQSIAAPGAGSYTLSNLAAGSYEIQINIPPCASSKTPFTVPVSSLTIQPGVLIPPSCALPLGSFSIAITGGTPPYTPVGSTTFHFVSPSPGQLVLTDLASGTYDVSLRDQTSCSNSLSVVIPAPPTPTIAVQSSSPSACGSVGGSVTLSSSLPPSPSDSWQWSDGVTTSTGTRSNLATGIHDVQLTAGACVSNTLAFFIGAFGNFTVSVSSIVPASNCSTDSPRYSPGQVTFSILSGAGPFHWNLSSSSTGWATSSSAPLSGPASVTVTVSGPGSYLLFVSDSSCSYSSAVTVPQDPFYVQQACGCLPAGQCECQQANCTVIELPGTNGTSVQPSYGPLPGVNLSIVQNQTALTSAALSWGSIIEAEDPARGSKELRALSLPALNWTRVSQTSNNSIEVVYSSTYRWPSPRSLQRADPCVLNLSLANHFSPGGSNQTIDGVHYQFDAGGNKFSLELTGCWPFANMSHVLKVQFSYVHSSGFTDPPTDCSGNPASPDEPVYNDQPLNFTQVYFYTPDGTIVTLSLLNTVFGDGLSHAVDFQIDQLSGNVTLVFPSFSASLFYDPLMSLLLGSLNFDCLGLSVWLPPVIAGGIAFLVVVASIFLIYYVPFIRRSFYGREATRVLKLRNRPVLVNLTPDPQSSREGSSHGSAHSPRNVSTGPQDPNVKYTTDHNW
ncbi:MAG: hypothetical protein Q8P67_26805 [archaeon]|nr:hypothetical protein [archaeon]